MSGVKKSYVYSNVANFSLKLVSIASGSMVGISSVEMPLKLAGYSPNRVEIGTLVNRLCVFMINPPHTEVWAIPYDTSYPTLVGLLSVFAFNYSENTLLNLG